MKGCIGAGVRFKTLWVASAAGHSGRFWRPCQTRSTTICAASMRKIDQIGRAVDLKAVSARLAITQGAICSRPCLNALFRQRKTRHERLGGSGTTIKIPGVEALDVAFRVWRIDDHFRSRSLFIRACRSAAGMPLGSARQAATRRASSESEPSAPKLSGGDGSSSQVSISSANASCSLGGNARARSIKSSSLDMRSRLA